MQITHLPKEENNMYHFFILFLLLPTTSLICIETHPSKMVSLQLDDGSQYSIAEWKVEVSDTLCKYYCAQKQQNQIIVPNISVEKIKLFDKAMDSVNLIELLSEHRQRLWSSSKGSFIEMPTRKEIIEEYLL